MHHPTAKYGVWDIFFIACFNVQSQKICKQCHFFFCLRGNKTFVQVEPLECNTWERKWEREREQRVGGREREQNAVEREREQNAGERERAGDFLLMLKPNYTFIDITALSIELFPFVN